MSKKPQNDARRYNLPTFQAPKLALVEGPDEFEFIRFLRKREDLQIHAYEGKNQLQLEITTIRAIEGFDDVRRVLIIRDSDADPAGALASVLTQWSNALSVPVPQKVQPGVWFADDTEREWCVWLMPDGGTTGDLETLLWRSVKRSDHTNCIETLIQCLSTCSPVPIGTESKARLYSWLATQQEPYKHLHGALNERATLFDPADPAFTGFAELLDSL